MNPNNESTDRERIGRLETSFGSLHEELSEIRTVLKVIQEKIAVGKETNWSLILSAIVVVGSLYASAIRPLEQDTIRAQRAAEELARAVLVANEQAAALRYQVVKLESKTDTLRDSITRIDEKGSPVTDRRLALIEQKLFQH